jgi:DNA-binding XRE family transcriptional regulator
MLTLMASRMTELELTDAALAVDVGVERSMITKLKLGKATASLPLALKLSDHLGLPPSEFVAKPIRRGAASKSRDGARPKKMAANPKVAAGAI